MSSTPPTTPDCKLDITGVSAPSPCSASIEDQLKEALEEIKRLKPLAEWALNKKALQRKSVLKWQQTHREKVREYNRKNYVKRTQPPEKKREYGLRHYYKNWDKQQAKNVRRRQKEKQTKLELSLYELKSKLD